MTLGELLTSGYEQVAFGEVEDGDILRPQNGKPFPASDKWIGASIPGDLSNSFQRFEVWRKPKERNANAVQFELTLFEDAIWKLDSMNTMDVLFDDHRNEVPEAYYQAVNSMKPGQKIRVTVEVLS